MLRLARKVDALRQVFATYYESPSPRGLSSCATTTTHQDHLKEVKAAIHSIAQDAAFCEEVGVDLKAGQVAYYLARDQLGNGGMSWNMLGAQEKHEWDVAVTKLDEVSELCGLEDACDGDDSPKDRDDGCADAEIEHKLRDEGVRELGSYGVNIPEPPAGTDCLEPHATVGASTLDINILDTSSFSSARVLVAGIPSSQASNMSPMGCNNFFDGTTNSISLPFKLKVADLVNEWKVRRYNHRQTSLKMDAKTQLSRLKKRDAVDPSPAQGWSSILTGGWERKHQSRDKIYFRTARIQPAVPRFFESSCPVSNSNSAEQLARKWTSFFQPPSPPTSGYTMSILGSNEASTNIGAEVNTREQCPPCELANVACYGDKPCTPCLESGKDIMYCGSHMTMSVPRTTIEMKKLASQDNLLKIKEQEAEELGDNMQVNKENDKNNSCSGDGNWAYIEAPPAKVIEVVKN